LLPRVRTWPLAAGDKPSLLGFAGFKAGMLHLHTVDDREKTPNFGKPMFSPATAIAVPPLFVYGLRAYRRGPQGEEIAADVYAKETPNELARRVRRKGDDPTGALAHLATQLNEVSRLMVLCAARPREARLAQKRPFVFELPVGGGDRQAQLEFAKGLLGREVRPPDAFKPGAYVDVIGITRGKGFEGPVTRLGIKRKQAKSRKSVRAVGTIGPWHPAMVVYTVPRAGQRGFHHRVEYNKKILVVGSGADLSVTPAGGFPHFGEVRGSYLIVRGSVPGAAKRPLKLRIPARAPTSKTQPPRVLELSVSAKTGGV
jgi:large subunit ribosomal protein L3